MRRARGKKPGRGYAEPEAEREITLHHPEPVLEKTVIFPVFLPFAGCARRCVYCAQQTQTNTQARPLGTMLADMKRGLAEFFRIRRADGRKKEIGLYGGTFTALPAPWPLAFLQAVYPYIERGEAVGARCSTRPDSIALEQLRALARRGLRMVELGVQSFDDGALARSGRGYTGAQALEACRMVREAGLDLGVQLMPGMPGMSKAAFRRDIELARSLAPQAVRLYPCLVLEGTELALQWQAGRYAPWTLEEAVEACAWACLRLWERNIPVIRVGVKEEPCLARAVLAGPWHPGFGDMVRGRALLEWLRGAVRLWNPHCAPVRGLALPRRFQGMFWGHAGMHRQAYADLGIRRVWFQEDARISLFL